MIRNFHDKLDARQLIFIHGFPGKTLLFTGIMALWILITGCSHRNPYYRPDVSQGFDMVISEADIHARVLLIGDAGAPQEQEPVLLKLREWVEKIPLKTVVIFLGDNIYPSGMPAGTDSYRPEAERRLTAQIAAFRGSGARGIFVPGNHDWKDQGQATLKRQEDFISRELSGDDHMLPQNGCPGPEKIDLEGLRLILLDTAWWIKKGEKSTEGCVNPTWEQAMEALREMVAEAGERQVIIAAHHPMATHGPHGGFFSWEDHLFPLTNAVDWLYLPLPVIGSIYPLGRWYLVNIDQDINGKRYRDMARQIKEAVSPAKPLIYIGGHEHSLQVMEGGEAFHYALVSGAGSASNVTKVGHGEETLFAHSHTGFMALDLLKDGRILLRVIEPREKEVVFGKWLGE